MHGSIPSRKTSSEDRLFISYLGGAAPPQYVVIISALVFRAAHSDIPTQEMFPSLADNVINGNQYQVRLYFKIRAALHNGKHRATPVSLCTIANLSAVAVLNYLAHPTEDCFHEIVCAFVLCRRNVVLG